MLLVGAAMFKPNCQPPTSYGLAAAAAASAAAVTLHCSRGACWIEPKDPLLGNLIKITHFGFHQTNTRLVAFQAMPQQGAACHTPERDIVAAPYSHQQELTAQETYETLKYDPQQIPNRTLLFFAGSIRPDEPEYSGGVRQVSIAAASASVSSPASLTASIGAMSRVATPLVAFVSQLSQFQL